MLYGQSTWICQFFSNLVCEEEKRSKFDIRNYRRGSFSVDTFRFPLLSLISFILSYRYKVTSCSVMLCQSLQHYNCKYYTSYYQMKSFCIVQSAVTTVFFSRWEFHCEFYEVSHRNRTVKFWTFLTSATGDWLDFRIALQNCFKRYHVWNPLL